MRPQSPRLVTFLRFLLAGLRSLRDRRTQPIQQLQHIASPPARPRSSRKRFQLLSSRFPPEPLLASESFVERHGLQLIHDSRARLHHAVPVPQQLPRIAILPARYPDLRKVILEHSSQNQLRILAIRLLLAHSLGADLRRVPDPQLDLQRRQQPLKPARATQWLPSPRAPSLPGPRDRGIASPPPRGAAIDAPRNFATVGIDNAICWKPGC
jgi:hypothetical protein